MAKVKLEVLDGKIVSRSLLPKNLSMKGITPDSNYIKNFHNEFLSVKKFTITIVGRLKNTITSRDAYFGPSEYIDMIHSLQLECTNADISFAAPLSLDVTIKSGDLNYQDLLNIYPFENQLYVIEMTGQEVKNYLEYSYSKWVNKMQSKNDSFLMLDKKGKDERSRFRNMNFNFDSAAGLIYEVDVRKGDGERINILSMANGAPFKLDNKYKIALSSYKANGGGDLLEIGAKIPNKELDKRVLNRLTDIRELLYKKLKQNGIIEAKKLNQWKFVPDNYITIARERDYQLLFKPKREK